MKTDEVPQNITYYEGKKRACYAVDENGKYVIVPSSGWDAEEAVNSLAVAELAEKLEKTRQEVLKGLKSPLVYYMEQRQMTPQILAKTAGIMGFRVRRHFKPEVFSRLKPGILERYAEALALSVNELKSVPDRSGKEPEIK